MTGRRLAQVHIYLPDAQHPAHGLVRVIVKDSRDNFTGAQSRTWLDSGERPSHPSRRALWFFCRLHGSCPCISVLLLQPWGRLPQMRHAQDNWLLLQATALPCLVACRAALLLLLTTLS